MNTMPKKLALLVGCNYVGTVNELQGCINDVTSFKQVLKNRFEFDESDITLFVDSVGTALELLPTGVNIKNKLKDLIARADNGDLIVFYYSGHGTQFPRTKLSSQLDEAIVPTDLNLITDIDFGNILSELRGGASFLFISDSCHSGGLLDKTRIPLEFSKAFVDTRLGNPKLIPYPALKRILDAKAGGGENTTVPQQMKMLFSDNASLKFTSKKKQLASMKDSFTYRGILFSACEANEFSLDVTIGGKHCGAFSAALQHVLRSSTKPFKIKDLSDSIISVIEASPYRTQHPHLYCDDKDLENIFLLQEHDAPQSTDFGSLPDIPGNVDDSADGSKDLDKDNINKTSALEQIKDVVAAYYRVSSKTFKENFEDLYGKVATAKGTKGAVSAKDWAELVSSVRDSDKEIVSDFSLEIVGTGDDLLDGPDAMMIYYASKTKLQFRCQGQFCGERVLNHLYFTCLSCFRMHEETYNVCATCLTEKSRCPHGHQSFIDSHSLLLNYHSQELMNMQKSSKEKGVQDLELKQMLDQAEKAFGEGLIFNDPKSKALGVNFGLQTDEGCSIM